MKKTNALMLPHSLWSEAKKLVAPQPEEIVAARVR